MGTAVDVPSAEGVGDSYGLRTLEARTVFDTDQLIVGGARVAQMVPDALSHAPTGLAKAVNADDQDEGDGRLHWLTVNW
jgi:hypothetical protein